MENLSKSRRTAQCRDLREVKIGPVGNSASQNNDN